MPYKIQQSSLCILGVKAIQLIHLIIVLTIGYTMPVSYTHLSSIDWQDEVFGGYAMTQSHNVNICTGTEKTQVMLSYNYNRQDGLLANHSANKRSRMFSVNAGLEFDFLKHFTYRIDVYKRQVYVKTTYYPHRLLHFETKSS